VTSQAAKYNLALLLRGNNSLADCRMANPMGGPKYSCMESLLEWQTLRWPRILTASEALEWQNLRVVMITHCLGFTSSFLC